ncbi:MAG: hypothetical protein A2X47_01295 [Lentisphaerae bacterium GWF2_38_69]|nr:MAG: hypothetical protein A2X47_01295 [Lentisphaerae bacterium GWF2_38_69]
MHGKVLSIYEKLYSGFGTQNWWPTTLCGQLEPSYNGLRPDDKGRFEIATGAILTQNTAWINVHRAIANLISLNILSPDGFLNSCKEELKQAIKPSGYFNQKYNKLINLANWWNDNFKEVKIGSNNNKHIEKIRNSLLAVNGIGPETADSILLYAFDMPSFVIDTYTKRILSRHYGVDMKIKYEELRYIFMKELPVSTELYKEYHALLVELGKNHCKKIICLTSCLLRK